MAFLFICESRFVSTLRLFFAIYFKYFKNILKKSLLVLKKIVSLIYQIRNKNKNHGTIILHNRKKLHRFNRHTGRIR